MGNIYLTDFKFGMDRRRARVAGTPGTLWTGKNIVITRGGDIERARRFVPTYTLPTGQTFGMGAVNGQLYAFGSIAQASLSPALPLGLQYQQLSAPSGAAMVQVLDVKAAGGQLYVIARFADGNLYHFYNGVRVTDWDTLSNTNFSYAALATYLAQLINADAVVNAAAVGSTITLIAAVPGTAFAISKSTTDLGGTSDQDITLTTIQGNVAGVTEVQATSVVTVAAGSTGRVTDVTAGGTSLMQAPVPWQGSTSATAAALCVQINDKSATHLYTATTISNTVTISAPPGQGAAANETVIATVTTGDIVLNTPTMSGGVTAVTPVAQVVTAKLIGTPESADLFQITINSTTYSATGRAATTGTSGYVVKRRLWSCAQSLWQYCKVNTFNNWTDANVASGAGFFNISNEAEGSEPLVGAGTYINYSAVFSRRNCRIYSLSTDATAVALYQPIDNTGALASRSILGYGTTDLFYLDETGIRSLKARDASGAAFVNDIGVAIDPFVRSNLDSLTPGVVQRACAVVEPRDGRYWLAVGPYIYVLSYFPGSSISAWTYFDPGFTVSDFARIYNQLYVRAGDMIYLYGGATGVAFPNANELVATVELPFVSMSPPQVVMLEGFDAAATGAWQVNVLPDPNNTAASLNMGIITNTTYANADQVIPGRSTHWAVNLTCSAAGAATISNLTLRHDGNEPNQ